MTDKIQGQRDIDRIIADVQAQLPDVITEQWQKSNPSQDDGIWFFSLPDLDSDVQIENSYGNCPFIVETNEQSSHLALKANTPQEAVGLIVEYLKAVEEGRTIHLPGQLYWQKKEDPNE